MNIPADLKYTKEHEWIKLEGNTAIIGVTDFAQSNLTDITFFEFPEVGREVNQMEEIGVIETSKAVSDIFSPVSGKIVDVNTALDDDPEIVNNDPYGDGWLVKIEVTDASEVDGLLTADAYKELID